jgi:hypothetical protein
MLFEPHYRLIFLSWLPRPWRSPYLRAVGKGQEYDCEPLQLGQLEKMLAQSGLSFENVCVEAMRITLEIERPKSLFHKVLRRIPDAVLQPLRSAIPTLIYRFSKDPPKVSAA